MSVRNWARRRWTTAVFLADSRLRAEARRLADLLQASERIPGWTRGREAVELLRQCYLMRHGAVTVEVGCFLGSATVLLAGARKLKGSGHVHCIDPFDASGDAFSVPHYTRIASDSQASLRQRFEAHIAGADLAPYVTVHQGTAESVGARWNHPVDLLFLDGDHSPEGARSAFDIWTPFLRTGGLIALHNSTHEKTEPGHDGFRRLAVSELREPGYGDVFSSGTTTFGVKRGPRG